MNQFKVYFKLIQKRNFKNYAKTSLEKVYNSLISLEEFINLHYPQVVQAIEFIDEVEPKIANVI